MWSFCGCIDGLGRDRLLQRLRSATCAPTHQLGSGVGGVRMLTSSTLSIITVVGTLLALLCREISDLKMYCSNLTERYVIHANIAT